MMELVKSIVLALCIVGILCVWGLTGSAAYHSTVSGELLMGDASYEGFIDWITGVWGAFVIFARIAFWVVIALLGTFIILLLMIVLGVGSWIIQRITQGIAYLVGVIKGQWKSTPRAANGASIVVAHKQNGDPVSLPEWMEQAHKQLEAHEERIKKVENRFYGTI